MKRMIITLILLAMTALPALAAPTNTSGPWGIAADGFKNLSTALASPATAGKTVVVSVPMAINNKTTDRAITVTAGGRINVASGKTLTINGPFTAGLYQVFAGSGAVAGLKEALPEWFATNTTPGTTDMAAGALAAFNALAAKGELIFSSGTVYGISSLVIDSKDNWRITVKGKIVSIASDTGAGAGVDDRIASQALYPVFKITNCNHWSLTGGNIDNRHREAFWIDTCVDFILSCDVLSNGLNDNLEGGRLRYCSNFQVKDMALDHVTYKAASGYQTHSNALAFFDCDHFSISGVKSRYNGMNGLYIVTGCSDFSVHNNLIEHNAGSGIQMTWASFTPSGTPHGDATAFVPIRWNISNNIIQFNRADGIDLANTYSSPVDVYGVVHGNITAYNGWDNEAKTGGAVTPDGSGFGTFSNINHFTVTDNHTIEPARTGLYALNCTDFVFSGNTAIKTRSGSADKGAYLSGCSNGLVQGNNIKVTGTMSALNTNPTMNNVIFRDNTFDGILEFNGGSYNKCKFIGNKCTAYTMVLAYMDFIDNDITVDNASQNGLQVSDNYLNIERNTVTATNFGLVSANMNGVRIIGNNIAGGTGGIRVDSNSSTQIIGNMASGGTSPGVHILGTSDNCVLASNRASSVSGNSLRVESTCTNTHKYGNIESGPTSYAGTFGINY